MRREITEPTTNEWGQDEHPSWGLIGASRISVGPVGAELFDSDIRHHNVVRVRIGPATRKRELHRDWIGSIRIPYIEIDMSEAQWASFVSTMNVGDGVPCTVDFRDGEYVARAPHAPRLAESLDEVRDAAKRAQEKVQAAFEAYTEKKSAENLRTLKYAIENLPANIAYAAQTLTEHAENVVQKSKADIEAMVVAAAKQAGLDAAGAQDVLRLTTGRDDDLDSEAPAGV